jgi:hypothetical protein
VIFKNKTQGSCICESTLKQGEEPAISLSQVSVDTCQFKFQDLTIYAEDLSVYELPKILSQNSEYLLVVQLGQLSKFTEYMQTLGRFVFTPKSKHEGADYRLNLKLIWKKSQLLEA